MSTYAAGPYPPDYIPDWVLKEHPEMFDTSFDAYAADETTIIDARSWQPDSEREPLTYGEWRARIIHQLWWRHRPHKSIPYSASIYCAQCGMPTTHVVHAPKLPT